MKSLIVKQSIALFGLSLAVAPLPASAAQWGIGVRVGGPAYNVHARYLPGPCFGCGWHRGWAPQPAGYGWHPYGWRPAPAVNSDGYYGWAPGGFYGYYWHGGWYAHRRWGNGLWIYF